MWEMLEKAGVKRCYGIVGDALNPVIDSLHRRGKVEFVHVRHEEYGVFAAVADACLTGRPVAVCGTAGPGVTHLFNGLMDARKEGAPIIAIAGDGGRHVFRRYGHAVNLDGEAPQGRNESQALRVVRMVLDG